MTGTIDHIRSTHEVSPVTSDAVHANAQPTAAVMSTTIKGVMERTYFYEFLERTVDEALPASPPFLK